MAKKIKCPDAEWFKRLINGQVTIEQEEKLSRHLESCSNCQNVLDEMNDLTAYVPETKTSGDTIRYDADKLKQQLDSIKSRDPSNDVSPNSGYMDVMPWMESAEQGIGSIDEFELRDFVGRGGMGVVFKSFDTKLQRNVALKLMSPQLLVDEKASTRFLREARSAAKINHPNIVTVHSVNEARGLPYLVMEFIDGESLEEKMQLDKLQFSEILNITRQSLSGLAAAHASDVLHRDIKPANIMLDNRTGNAKIADFGLACTAKGSNLTQTGFLVGTPDFISPEQTAGESIDQRSDLFSLGSVLYAMCCGTSPFSGPSIISTLQNVRSKQPESIEKLNHDVPKWFAGIVNRLLEKEPGKRFKNAESALTLLESSMGSAESDKIPNIDLSVNKTIRSQQLQSQNRHLQSLALVTVASLMLIATIFWWFYANRENRPPLINVNQTNVAENTRKTVEPQSELPGLTFAGDSRNDVIVNSLDQLKSALALDQDQITIRFDGETTIQLTQQLTIHEKEVTLIGDEEEHVLLEVEFWDKPAIWIENGTLNMQRIEIRSQFEIEDENEEVHSLFSCHDSQLKIDDCRIYNRTFVPCVQLFESSFDLTNSQILSLDTAIDWGPTAENQLNVDNSWIVSPTNVHIDESYAAQLTLSRCTFVGEEAIGVDAQGDGTISINTKNNLFLTSSTFLRIIDGDDHDEEPDVFSRLQLHFSGDVFPSIFCAIQIDDDSNREITFADSKWSEAIQTGGCTLLDRDDMEEIEIDDLVSEIFAGEFGTILELVDPFDNLGAHIED